VAAVGCLGARVLTVSITPTSSEQGVFATHLRLDSLLFGVLLSYLWHVRGLRSSALLRRWRFAILLVGIALVTPVFVWPVERHPWIPTYGLTLVYIGCGVILLAMLSMRIPERRPVGAVAALGAYSYSIYLWHLAVKHWIVAQLVHLPVQSWFIYACVYFGGAVVVGGGMARLIEY